MRLIENRVFLRNVDEALWWLWDPIGVNENPFARSEYENYVVPIAQLTIDADSSEILAKMLASLCRDRMCSSNPKKDALAAEYLIKLRTWANSDFFGVSEHENWFKR